MKDNRDALDFGKTEVRKLYMKIFIPTLLGMVSTIVMTITDGYFVGQYAGSDALAAVNISVPLFLLATGFALMFGVGCSVVAATHLSKGNIKAANINLTQTVIASLSIFAILTLAIVISPDGTAKLLGASEALLPLATSYISILMPSLVFYMLMNLGFFMIRLDGAPKYAMLCSLIPAFTNILGDFILVGELNLGISGAAWATAISYVIGGTMVLVYFLGFSKILKIYKLKLSIKSLQLAIRNITVICKLGFSGMLSELAISLMVFLGNFVFFKYLGDNGVAAFAVVCYCLPISFMVINAIAQSAQPIISFNITSTPARSIQAKNISIKIAAFFGVAISLFMALFAGELSALFLKPDSQAYLMAVKGLPVFAMGLTFYALNIVYMGYLQSIEQVKIANLMTILRGFILPVIMFIFTPMILGEVGIWLAIPIAEFTALITLYFTVRNKRLMPI